MTSQQQQDIGITLLRVSLGVIFIAHSAYLKLVVFGLSGTLAYFESLGIPAIATYAVIAAEILGGTALVVGFKTRWAAAAVLPVAVGATWAHLGGGWLFSNAGGGWEYPLLLAVLSVVQVLLGSGAYAIDRFSPQAQHLVAA